MEELASDMNGECLVTDLVNELSSGLEIPFLLRDDILLTNKEDNMPYDDSFHEKNFDYDFTFDTDDNKMKCNVKNETEDDLISYWQNNDMQSQSFNQTSGTTNESRSCSECSSTEMWMVKNDLDTPPVTPPDEQISSDNPFLMSPEALTFIPTKSNDLLMKKLSQTKNESNEFRIQPKPYSDDINIFDFQGSKISTIINNDMNSVMKTKNSYVFLNANKEKKKAVLSKKDLELQAKRKQERMIRNRESAYLSRKRKKEHVALLEKQVKDLLAENTNLRLENFSLRKKLANYEVNASAAKNSRNILKNSSRKATALFALLFTFCLNFNSFGFLVSDVKWDKNKISEGNIAAVPSSEVRHARSLLWTETDFKDMNNTYYNLTTTSCPAHINQSESIRLESELRKWIGTEDDYSGPYKNNVSKLSQYFYTGDKPQAQKENIKIKKRKKRLSFLRKGNIEMNMYKIKANVFNVETLFEAIHRRDDTFYLLSFSGDHLLLPALSHNKTSRPKMSLMLPAFLSNVTGATTDQMEMMQIDCEVTNTQVLSVTENDIPAYMRPFSNFTTKTKGNIVQKTQKYNEFFMNNEENLLSLKQSQFNSKESLQSVRNYTTIKSVKKPVLKVALTKLIKSLQSEYKFDLVNTNEKNSKVEYLKNQFKVLDNITANQTAQKSLKGKNTNRKNLLKMLMVNSYVSHSKGFISNFTGNESDTEKDF